MAGALNFKDVMLAYGKLARAALAHAGGTPGVGFEFAGTVGRRRRTRWQACLPAMQAPGVPALVWHRHMASRHMSALLEAHAAREIVKLDMFGESRMPLAVPMCSMLPAEADAQRAVALLCPALAACTVQPHNMARSGGLVAPASASPCKIRGVVNPTGSVCRGQDGAGRRVMGIARRALATRAAARPSLIWRVPAGWTLAQAASVPVAYATAYYALVARGRLRPGQTVLVHSGAGGVGLAALAVALRRGCEVSPPL
jgi:hypothetical protein